MASENYITREFSDIKGIDAAAPRADIDADRAAVADDLYPCGGRLKTRPALIHAGTFKKPVDKAKGAFGVYSVGDRVLLRLGAYMLEWLCFPAVNGLKYEAGELVSDADYKVLTSSLTSRIGDSAPLSGDAAVDFDDALYVYDKNGVFRFGKNGVSVYSPTDALTRMKAVDSVSKFNAIEDRDAPFLSKKGKYVGRKNMLSPCFRISVAANGESKTFALGKSGAKAISCVYVTGGAEKFRALSDADAASVSLPAIPDKGSEITVLCYLPVMSGAVCEPLCKAVGTVFDGRVFLCAAADKNASGRIIYSAEGDPFFFAENAVCHGSEQTEALAEAGKYLAATERAGAAAPLIRFHYPRTVSDDAVGKEYPAEYGLYDCGVTGVGNTARHLGSPLFVSEDGVKRITAATANGTAELEAASAGIDPILRKKTGTPRLTETNGMAALLTGTDLFVSFARAKNERTGAKENGWFRWTNIASPGGDAPFEVCGIGAEKNGRTAVFSGTADGEISVEYLGADAGEDYAGTEAERAIEPCLETAETEFSDRTRLKRLSKRGCAFYADGDVKLYIVPDPNGTAEQTEKYEVNIYGRCGRFAFRPTAEAAHGFGAVIKGRGKIGVGAVVLSARKTKQVGGKR